MSEVTLERVVAEAKTLTPQEQQQLRSLLDDWLSTSPKQAVMAQQQLLAEALLAEGLLDHIPAAAYDPSSADQRPPIQITGRPLSETLLEDRG